MCHHETAQGVQSCMMNPHPYYQPNLYSNPNSVLSLKAKNSADKPMNPEGIIQWTPQSNGSGNCERCPPLKMQWSD
jgi:hypothetical protein